MGGPWRREGWGGGGWSAALTGQRGRGRGLCIRRAGGHSQGRLEEVFCLLSAGQPPGLLLAGREPQALAGLGRANWPEARSPGLPVAHPERPWGAASLACCPHVLHLLSLCRQTQGTEQLPALLPTQPAHSAAPSGLSPQSSHAGSGPLCVRERDKPACPNSVGMSPKGPARVGEVRVDAKQLLEARHCCRWCWSPLLCPHSHTPEMPEALAFLPAPAPQPPDP